MIQNLIGPFAMRNLKLVGYALLVALLAGTHTAAYMKGRADEAAQHAEVAIEQLETDIVDNAERIERQVTSVSRATVRFQQQARKLEEAINENAIANLDPNCNLSDAEFRLFNESIAETASDVSRGRAGALLGLESAKKPEPDGAKD